MLAASTTPSAASGRGPRRLTATLVLLLGGAILPNALALGSGVWIGTPPRCTAIALYALLALLCDRMPRPLAAALYLLILASDLGTVIKQMFFLDSEDMGTMLGLLGNVDVLASPFYTGLLAALSIIVVANVAVLLLARTAMAAGSRLVFGLVVGGGLAADLAVNESTSYTFGALASVGKPFEAGVALSGFGDLAHSQTAKGNVLMVLVESLGVMRDPRHRAILFSAFEDDALRQRFAMRTGTSTFFGQTSHGEMRELCQSRARYQTILDGEDPTCLPGLFAARGYETISIHGFTGAFYERKTWYPRVGFRESGFPETFPKPYPRRCGSSFLGPCDVDIADSLSRTLSEATRPTFVYWLTLNSHVPVRPGQATRRHACETGGPFGDPEVCAMAEIWQDLFEAVGRLALANPNTEILLVGDHAPPLWRRAARTLFAPDRVPWIRLTPRLESYAAR